MIKKLTFSTLVLLCFFSISFAQETSKRQAIYVELGGAAFMGSVNYDFRFKPGNDGLGARFGLGYVPDVLIVPMELNGLVGKNRVAFEYGVGISAAYFTEKHNSGNQTFRDDDSRFGIIFHGKAGIRITPANNGLFFNFNCTPLINTEETRLWFGLGLGYSWH
ncbi:hypothetical protein [Maribellus sediminis]|uniref:hypothetical protein n=1 Tax=Maribellus sediminis TaxID=2696285 RepID=UPI00142FE42E|nr:hypothetical protein [Maribellus sediminis]